MTTTSSILLRNASRGVRALSGHVGREKASNLRLVYRGTPSSVFRTSFSTDSDGGGVAVPSHEERLVRLYEPLAAVAYADHFEDGCSDDKSSCTLEVDRTTALHAVNHDVTSTGFGTSWASASGGPTGRGPSSSTPYPPPSSMASSKGAPPLKAGGGGTGRHRCPACGNTVTFRCDYEENNFYCASCSGWFVINPNKNMGTEDGKSDGNMYDASLSKDGSRTMSDREILMRHVSCTSYKQISLFTVKLLNFTHARMF